MMLKFNEATETCAQCEAQHHKALLCLRRASALLLVIFGA